MRLRSTISGAETLPEMQTSTPQPECIRIPKAAFFMLTEDDPRNASGIKPILEKGKARRANRRRWATDFERVLRSALSREHLITDQASARLSIKDDETLPDLVGARECPPNVFGIAHNPINRFPKHAPPARSWHPSPQPQTDCPSSRAKHAFIRTDQGPAKSEAGERDWVPSAPRIS